TAPRAPSGMTRRHLALLAAGLFLALNALGYAADPGGPPAEIRAARIPLYPANPAEKRAGTLIYRGGLVLRSSDRAFGGWSDLAVSADGGEILAISDEAHW